jgi:hypothetical protein
VPASDTARASDALSPSDAASSVTTARLPLDAPAEGGPSTASATTPASSPSAPAAAPSHGLDDLYDIGRLADRLGVEHATIRVWLSRRVPWLPQPDGRLNGGAVWRASTLEGIEQRRRPGRPGRKPKFVPAPEAADVPRTNPAPSASSLAASFAPAQPNG